jgi:hypothetical protein
VFTPLTTAGTHVDVGQRIGHVCTHSALIPVCTPFSGQLVMMAAVAGERVDRCQRVAGYGRAPDPDPRLDDVGGSRNLTLGTGAHGTRRWSHHWRSGGPIPLAGGSGFRSRPRAARPSSPSTTTAGTDIRWCDEPAKRRLVRRGRLAS